MHVIWLHSEFFAQYSSVHAQGNFLSCLVSIVWLLGIEHGLSGLPASSLFHWPCLLTSSKYVVLENQKGKNEKAKDNSLDSLQTEFLLFLRATV